MTERRRKVFVTGAGGFIGSNLVRDQLARGYGVVATDIDLGRLDALQLEGDLVRAEIDIRAVETMRRYVRGVDTIFHLAAAHLDVLKDESHFYDVNARASGDFVRLAAEEGVRRFVHCSTVGVYGSLDTLPADEETRPEPDIPYERTKLAGEQAVRDAASESGLSTVIVRPAWVYGPLCPRTLKLIRSIARRRFLFVGDGANLRHPIYIADMLEAFELAAVRAIPSGEIVIAAGPETVSVRRLVELIVEELGIRYRPVRVPEWLMQAVCLAVEKTAGLVGREPPFSRRSLKFFTDSSAFTIAKAERLLDFRPRFDTRRGLRLTIQHCREQGLL
jgi:nucleoside-diphosphate-sugar epimerase